MKEFLSPFYRRLLLWWILSLSFASVLTIACDMIRKLTFQLTLWKGITIILAYALYSLLALSSYCYHYGNGGGNSFDRFSFGVVRWRIGAALLSGYLLVVLLADTFSLTFRVIPMLAMAYIAHETVFSYEKDSTIPMAPLPLLVMMRQVVGRSSVQAIRLSGKTLSVLLAGRVLASLVNWTPWLRELIPLYLVISLREMAFLVFPVAAAGDFLQATLTYSLLYPIDFSKISQDDTKGLLDALTIKESSLSMAVNSTSSLSTMTNRDSRDWVRAYESFMAQLRRQVLPSSSSSSLALPQLSMLAGNDWKDFFQLLIASQAQCDLNRLIRTQPYRRKQIFEEKEWHRLVSVELETIAVVTVQVG